MDALETMEGMDFGKDIIPALLARYKVAAYPYQRQQPAG